MALPVLDKAPWLAQTKLRPPHLRADALPRQRLLDWLSQSVSTEPLTLLSAPAGYGKTTLLAHLPRLLPDTSITWLALDEEDNDANSFLLALIGALQQINPACGLNAQETLPLVEIDRPIICRFIGQLINSILDTLPNPSVLVFDDLHTLSDPVIYGAIDYLLDHLPAALHIVIATRRDPPIGLPRLRGRQQVAELRLPDLRFTLDETAVYLTNALALQLSPTELAILADSTEGWAAGINLIAHSLENLPDAQHRADFITHLSQTHQHIFDYLSEEVLQQQSSERQQFLLQTSILPELTPELCTAVTHQPYTAKTLEQLYRQNLFVIAVSGTAHTYRYHALFAAFLRHRLIRDMPDQLPVLHARAADAQTTPARALHHYSEAQLWDDAAQTIINAGETLIRQGRLDTLMGWIRSLPDATRRNHPRLAYLLGLCAVQKGDLSAAERWLMDEALPGMETAVDPSGKGAVLTTLASVAFLQLQPDHSRALVNDALQYPLLPYMQVQALMNRASLTLFFGTDWEAAMRDTDAAIAIAEAGQDQESLLALTLYLGQEFTLLPGGLDRLEQFCQRVSPQSAEQIRPVRLGLEDLLAFIHLRRGRLTEAIAVGESALRLKAQLGGYPFLGAKAAITVAVAHAAQGDDATAEQYLQLWQSSVTQLPLNRFTAASGLYPLARIRWLQGDMAALQGIYTQTMTLTANQTTAVDLCLQSMMRGLLAMAQKQYATAENHIQQAIAQEQTGRLSIIFDSARLLLARLYLDWNKREQAMAQFMPILDTCQRDNTPGVILQEGALVVPLLQAAPPTPFVVRLREQLATAVAPIAVAPHHPLTDREMDVLRLIAAGCSNQAISDELVISIPTVKSHVSHILQKLNASSRGEAAALARKTGIIEHKSL